MRSLNLALTWFATTTTTFIFCLLMLIYISFNHEVQGISQAKYQLYKALPASATSPITQTVEINTLDARSLLIENFFKGYNSQLAKYAQTFVDVADRYHLDFRLLPSIAMQESNGAKIMPNNSYNPFGYGIYGGGVKKFTSFEEAIDRVGKGLKEDYLDKGLNTPEEIMTKYTPPSIEKGGAWAKGVSTFMEELK